MRSVPRLWACLITPDGTGWLGIVPDLPGLELRAGSAYDVEMGLPAAIAAWLPAKPPRPVARLAYVRLPGRGETLRPPLTPEALRAARSAIRAMLGSRPSSDLANRLADWDLELHALEPTGPAPASRPGVSVGFSLKELPGDDGPEQVLVGRDAEGHEVAVAVLPTSAKRPA